MSSESKTTTAKTREELEKQVQNIIAEGWNADGGVIENPDGTFSQRMIKK